MLAIVKLLFSNYDIALKNKAYVGTLIMILNLREFLLFIYIDV